MFEEFPSEPAFEAYSDNLFKLFLDFMYLAARELRRDAIQNLLEQRRMRKPACDRNDPVGIRPFWHRFSIFNLFGPVMTE